MRPVCPALLLLGLLSLPAWRAAADERPEKAPGVVTGVPGSLVFTEDPHQRFADSYQHSVVEHAFTAENHGTRPVTIEQALAVRGSAELTAEPTVIAPGGQLRVRVRQPLGHEIGETAFRYALVTDEPGVSRYRFSLSGFVQSAYDPERPAFDLGFIDRDRGARSSLEIFSREVDRLELLGVATGDPTIRLEVSRAGIAVEGLLLTAILDPGAALGTLSGKVTLTTNVANQATIEIPWSSQVFGDLVPSEHPIAFGLIRAGERVTKDITLRSRRGHPFSIEGIDDSGGGLSTDVAPCSGDGPADCWVVRLTVEGTVPMMLGGTLRITTDRDDETLPLSYGGIVVGRDTAIRQLELGESSGQAPFQPPASPAPAGGSR
jgi:hypothetical protein